jgi:hypothetical protein
MEASGMGMGMGDAEHRFLFDFVKFLLAQGLAQIDYSDCPIDWVERQMQPHFVAPLSPAAARWWSLFTSRRLRSSPKERCRTVTDYTLRKKASSTWRRSATFA